MEQLSKGKSYLSLKESWIVFFCTFDPFGLGLPVYTVRQTYEEAHEAKYDDGTHKVLRDERKRFKAVGDDFCALIPIMPLRGISAKTKR